MAAREELQWAADEDIQDFRFVELRKISFGDSGVENCNDQRFSLLCTSNHFGLTFVGCKTGVYAFHTALLYTVDKDERIGKRQVMADKANIGPTHIPTPAPPVHVALSSDGFTLSVCVKESGMVKIYFYDTRALANKGKQMEPFCNIALSTEKDVRLLDLQWNPGSGFPSLLLAVVSTGVVSLLEITDKVTVLVRRAGLQANCVCWSPKGKQLALGMKNGDVVQCTAKTFEEKRRHPQPPNMVSGKLMQVADLCWLTSFEFVVTYIPQDQSTCNVFMAFLFTPNNLPPSYTCAEDPYGYYGGVDSSKKNVDKFHFAHMQQWGVLITCSNNSVDTPCFGQEGGAHGVIGDGSRGNADDYHGPWWQWSLDEGGRVEPPLDSDSKDTHSVGVAIDYTSQEVVPINDTISLPCSPLFLSLTDRGVLCPYTILNTGCSPDKIAELMSPPKPLPSSPGRQQISASAPPPSNVVTPSAQAKAALPLLKGFTLGSAPPMATLGHPNTSPKSNPPNLTAPTTVTGPGPSTLTSVGAQKPSFGIANIGQPNPSFSLGGGRVFGQPNLLPGQTAGPTATSGTSSRGSLFFNSAPISKSGGFSFNPAANTGGLSHGGQQQNIVTTTSTYPSPGVSLNNPGGGVLFPFSAKPGQLQPSSDAAKITSTALPISGPPSFTSLGIGSGFSGLRTSAPALSFAPNKTPTTVVNTSKPVVGSTVPSLGSTVPSLGGLAHPITTSLSGLGQNPPIGRLYQPQSTYTPLSASKPAVHPATGGLSMTTGPMMSTLPKSGPALGTSQTKLPPAAPVATHTLVSSTVTSITQPPIITPSRPPPKTPEKTTKANGDGTESVDGSADQEVVENKFAADITTEIDKFATEIDSQYDDILELGDVENGTVYALGTVQDLTAFSAETKALANSMQDVTKTFKASDRSSDHIKEETFKGFEMYEEARINTERNNDPKYASLLKVRPLDSYSAKRLNNLRASFLQVSRATDEINSLLDAQLERKYEERRRRGKNLLKAPSIQTVYSTLRDQTRIIRLQNDSMANITDDMKKLKLIPKSWQSAAKIVHSSPVPPATPRAERDRTPIRSTRVQGREKLRECLEAIKKTPVKKVKKSELSFKVKQSMSSGSPCYAQPEGTLLSESPDISTINTRYEPVIAGFVTSQQPTNRSLNTNSETSLGSFRPDVLVSPNRNISVQRDGSYQNVSTPQHCLTDASTIDGQYKKQLTTPITTCMRLHHSLKSNSDTSLGTFKPAVMLSPSHNISVRTVKGGYSSRESTPQLSRQSSGPCVISSPDGEVTIKDEGKYKRLDSSIHVGPGLGHSTARVPNHTFTGIEPEILPRTPVNTQALVRTNTPSTGTGTVHWGSPSTSQPKTASLAPSLSVAMPTPIQPTSIRADIDLNSLRRTSPYGDLSQIKPPSSEDTEPSSLVPNTSLSVPNIAPNKSVEESLPLFDRKSSFYASSPQVQQINPISTSTLPSFSMPLPPTFQIGGSSLKPAPLNPPVAPVVPNGMALGVLAKSTVSPQMQSVSTIAMPSIASTTTTMFALSSFSKSMSLPASTKSATFQAPFEPLRSNVTPGPVFPFSSTGIAATTKAFTLGPNSPFHFDIGSTSRAPMPAVSTTTATTTANIGISPMVNAPAHVPLSCGTETPSTGISQMVNAPARVPLSCGTGTPQLTIPMLDNNQTTKTGIEVPGTSNKDASNDLVVDIDSSRNIVEIDKTQHTLKNDVDQQTLTTSEPTIHPVDLKVTENPSTESVHLSPKITDGVKTPAQSEAISVSTASISIQQVTIEPAVPATQSPISSINTLTTAALSSVNADENTLKKEQQNITVSGAISSGVNGSSVDSEGSNEEDDDAMMGDDMEPIDDSTGQNTPSFPSTTPLGGLSLGLGRPQPTNVTANPFGTPNSSIVTSPPTQPGLLRSSAFGQGFQTSQCSSAPVFCDSNLVSGSSTGMFGQKASFGSPPSLNASTSVSVPIKVFGSGTGGGATGVGSAFEGNQSSGTGLTFGNLANTGGGLGSGSLGFGSSSSPLGGGSVGFVRSPVGGGSTGTGFGALAGGSIDPGTSGNQSSFSGWR